MSLTIGAARCGSGPQQGDGPREIFGDAAKFLGLSPQDLRSQLRSGKSLADIAQSEGKSVDDLRSTLLEAAGGNGSSSSLASRIDRLIQHHRGHHRHHQSVDHQAAEASYSPDGGVSIEGASESASLSLTATRDANGNQTQTLTFSVSASSISIRV
jgi:hypothetical protein